MALKKINKKKITAKKPTVKKTNKSKPAAKNHAKTAKKAVKPAKAAKPVKKVIAVKKVEKKVANKIVAKAQKQTVKPVAVSAPKINTVKEFTKPVVSVPVSSKPSVFDKGVKVVYPAHGVGEIIGVETHLIAGTELKQYVIQFEREKMILRVPVSRAEKSGLRKLSSDGELKDMKKTLLERPKSSRGMWSRRAKEYESKINSGNIIAVAEVVRDLHKNVDDPERSYSERVIYENALERLAREVSAIKSLDIPAASDYLVKTINDNNPYFIKKAAAKKAAAEAADDEDSMAA